MDTRQGFTLIELMIVVVIIGILAAIGIPNYVALQDHAKEARAKGTAHTVQLAAEDYAVGNDGIYSDAAADLQPLLPGGNLMENAFTGAVSEPQFGAAAATVGQIGIVAVIVAGLPAGYTVTCFGKEQMILTVSSGI